MCTMKIQLLTVMAMLSVTACTQAPSSYIADTASFAAATNSLGSSAEKILMLTDTASFDQMVFKAEYGFATLNKSDFDNPLFPAEDMAARKQALVTLQLYAKTLGSIAGKDISTPFYDNVKSLKSSVISLEDQVGQMTGKSTTNLTEKTGVIADLVASFGKMVIETSQTEAITKAVLNAEKPMARLSQLLDEDMQLVFGQLSTVQVLKFAAAADAFNIRACASPEADTHQGICKTLKTSCETTPVNQPTYCHRLKDRKTFTQKERSLLANVIRQTGEVSAAQNQLKLEYSQTQNGFRSALQSLVNLAKSERSPQTLGQATADMTMFLNRASELALDVDAVVNAFHKSS